MNIQVLQEYPGPGKDGEQDIMMILRPQTNNYYFESILLSIFRESPEYKKTLFPVYLANMPGEIIQKYKLLEKHYEYRLFFAINGAKHITDRMASSFLKYFSVDVTNSVVLGAYEALSCLEVTENELFSLTSSAKKQIKIEGQSISQLHNKYNDSIYVINGDIPALLTFHHEGTNSAVIIFRTTLSYKEFNRIILQILTHISRGLRDDDSQISKGCKAFLSAEDIEHLHGKDFYRHKRIFHFSHGPFEQILDSRDFLFTSEGIPIPMEYSTFAHYLLKKSVSLEHVKQLVRNPLVKIESNRTKLGFVEDSLYVFTRNMMYDKAFSVINKIKSYEPTAMSHLTF